MADEWKQVYDEYKASPNPESLGKVVSVLQPTISYALGNHGAADDNLLKGHAQLMAADAVEKYDPKFGAALPTFVTSQLRQLSRTARQTRSPMAIADRAQIEGYQLFKAEKELEDQHGREPTVAELSDFTSLSPKRIEKIRRGQYATPSESGMPDVEGEGPDFEQEALSYVYADSDSTDQKIIEHKVGYGGSKILSPKEVAIKLNLTPVQLSRRSARITAKINEIKEALETV